MRHRPASAADQPAEQEDGQAGAGRAAQGSRSGVRAGQAFESTQVCQQARASDGSAGASIQTRLTQRPWCPCSGSYAMHRRDSPRRARAPARHRESRSVPHKPPRSCRESGPVGSGELPRSVFQGEPYLVRSSGALTAFTIDLVSRPAAAAAAAAIAERSRRCLRLTGASRGGGVPDLYSGGSIGSTASGPGTPRRPGSVGVRGSSPLSSTRIDSPAREGGLSRLWCSVGVGSGWRCLRPCAGRRCDGSVEGAVPERRGGLDAAEDAISAAQQEGPAGSGPGPAGGRPCRRRPVAGARLRGDRCPGDRCAGDRCAGRRCAGRRTSRHRSRRDR